MLNTGFRHFSNIPGGKCRCGDPGNYLTLEVNGLDAVFRCWCGSQKKGSFDSVKERDEFLKQNGLTYNG